MSTRYSYTTRYDDPIDATTGYDEYRRTPEDDRIRAIAWLLIIPMATAGFWILAWAVWQVIVR